MARKRHRVVCLCRRCRGRTKSGCGVFFSYAIDVFDRADGFRVRTLSPVRMRRALALVLLVAAIGCRDSLLGPVQTVDGQWTALQNGYSLSFNLTQSGTEVTGTTLIAGVSGATDGTVSGTFVYPTLHLELTLNGITGDVVYDGTMSPSEAKIFGKLNGSGLTNVEIDVRKKK